jgi:TolB-like protein
MWAVPGLIAVGLLVAWLFLPRGPGASSIAVLPFENSSNDDEVAFLCDGIPESLINRLSLIPDFKVISRASSFNYRGGTTDPRTIGNELGVQTVLLGRLERRGDQLSISTELVDVNDSRQIWGQRYTRPSADVLKIEDEIAGSIADRLQLELSPETKQKLEQSSTVNPEAYQLYLKGRFTILGSNAEMDQAIEYFREATRIDPAFAEAWAGIAEGLALQAYLTVESRETLMGEARAALETALAHNPNSSEVYVAKGLLNFYLDWDWQGSLDALQRAIELNPGNAAAYNRYADVLLAFGRIDEALTMSLKSRELDPISVSPTHDLGWLYFTEGKFDPAEEQFAAARGLHPDWTWGYVKGGLSNAYLGNRKKTLELMDIVEEKTGGWGSDLIQSWVVLAYAIVGDTTRARFAFDRMLERAKIEPMDGIAMAEALIAFGRNDEALDWLERAVDERSPTAVWIKAVSGTIYKPIADTERFRAVLARMHFPD